MFKMRLLNQMSVIVTPSTGKVEFTKQKDKDKKREVIEPTNTEPPPSTTEIHPEDSAFALSTCIYSYLVLLIHQK